MRRRIDKWDLSDATASPHQYMSTYTCDEPPMVLRDQEAWTALETARAAVQAAEARVTAALVEEPFDPIEIECGTAMMEMVEGSGDTFDSEKWDAYQARLLDHAGAA